MLQIDHVYEFLYQELFKDFEVWHLFNGVPKQDNISISDISVFTPGRDTKFKIFFYDQEPLIRNLSDSYLNVYNWVNQYSLEEKINLWKINQLPYNIPANIDDLKFYINNQQYIYKKGTLVTSEFSKDVDVTTEKYSIKKLYYFFHGFAALDWYRGHYALNCSKNIKKSYLYDFISYNRIINNDRSYRIYLVSQLKEQELLNKGLVSFGVCDNMSNDWRDEITNPNSKLSDQAKQHAEKYLVDINKLVVDQPMISGRASADIPRDIDAFWHVVTETVFYYDKLHLTEKIFKPIVSKQPFMLLAAPGNLAYLKRYGFKTFDTVIDESYDNIQDPDARIEAVVKQLHWYCNLSAQEKTNIIRALEPIILHNFNHFYGEFRHIITQELITNTKTLFKDIGYNDSHIKYDNIYHVLTH